MTSTVMPLLSVERIEVERQMTKLNDLSKAHTKFCHHWLPCDASVQSRRLTGYFLAVPLMSALNLTTHPVAISSSVAALCMAILALAIPLIFIAWLSKFDGEKTRAWSTIALAPSALLLITQAHLNMFPNTVLVLAILWHEANKGHFARVYLAVSALITVSLASVLMASNNNFLSQLADFATIAPAAISAILYLLIDHLSVVSKEQTPSHSPFELACTIAVETGSVALEVDRKARVSSQSQNAFDVLHMNRAELSENAFLDRVHVSDKVILLSHLDAVSIGKNKAYCSIRLKVSEAAARKSNLWLHVSCCILSIDNSLIILISAPDQSTTIEDAETNITKSALTIVSHELRTPLNAIIGFADLIGKGLAGELANDRQREYIGLIQQSGQHLLQLVNSILDLSKLEKGTYELKTTEFLPAQVAEFAISILAVQAGEKQIGLNYLNLCGLDSFFGDSGVAQQIIINLLSNAVKFTPNHGQITLSVEMDDTRLIVCVKDTGVGMSKEELLKVGTPYYQVSNNHNRHQEGAGLGLSLVRQLATLHGGALEICSEQGKGTSARVALASQHPKNDIITYLPHKEADESVQPIQVNKERHNGTPRKTA